MAAQPAQADPQVALAATQDYAGAEAGQAPHDQPASQGATLVEGTAGLVGQRVGKYRVRRELGRGGMGVVYQAEHEEIGQRAALKTLHAEISSNPQFRRRFLNGMRAQIARQRSSWNRDRGTAWESAGA